MVALGGGFALEINYLVQHEFLCAMFGIVHFLHPQERVCGFEFFGDTALFYQPGEGEVELPLCLLLGIVEVLIECTRGEKRGISSATVLFHKVKTQVGILGEGVICLLGERKVGVIKSVMFGISNLILHCKYPFLRMFSFGINYQGYLLRWRSGVMPTTAD